MMLLRSELKKMLSLPHIIIIAAAVVIVLCISFVPIERNHPYSREIYKSYTDELYGIYTADKEQYINDRYESFLATIEKYDAMSADYKNDKITLEEFDAYNFEYSTALAQISTVEYLKQKCDYFNQTGGEFVFFYDTDWEDFLSGIGFDYITALVVFIIVISAFCPEYESGAHSLMLTTVKGRNKLCFCKLIMSAVMAFAVAFLLCFVKYAAFTVSHAEFADMPIKNLLGYSGFAMTIKEYYFRQAFIKAVSWAVGGVFISMVSNLTKSTVFSAFISFVFVVCAAMLKLTGGVLSYVLLGTTLAVIPDYEFCIPLFLIISAVKIALYGAVSVVCWNKSDPA